MQCSSVRSAILFSWKRIFQFERKRRLFFKIQLQKKSSLKNEIFGGVVLEKISEMKRMGKMEILRDQYW
jgi:hypothetical protein